MNRTHLTGYAALLAAGAFSSIVLMGAEPVGRGAPAGPAAVSISFAAVAGKSGVRCGQPIRDIGTTKSTVSITDLRFYVSNPRFVMADGSEVSVALDQDGLWQTGTVALLDFEDKTAECSNGTEQIRTVIAGATAAAAAGALRFELGLPFEINHRDPTLQPSPLNLTRLFWNWNAGYKFARIDLKTTGQPRGWVIHLGSTGCTPSIGPNTVPVSCKFPNRPTITLPNFDPARHVVAFDLAALLADANVDVNQPETAAGCMSGQGDSDCGPLFGSLALPFGTNSGGTQRVFRAIDRGAVPQIKP